MREPIAQAGQVLGGQVVAGMRLKEDTSPGRELLIPFPQQYGQRQAREGLEAETGIGQVEGLAAQGGSSRAERSQILAVALGKQASSWPANACA